MGNTWFNTLPYFTGLYALTPIFEHAAIYTETSLSLGKLYLSQEVLSQRLCVCLLILNARRVTLHVRSLLSVVARPRTITKLPSTSSCLSTNTRVLRASRVMRACRVTKPGILKKVHESCRSYTDGLISISSIEEHSFFEEHTFFEEHSFFDAGLKKPSEILPSDFSNPVVHYHVEIFNAVGTRTLAHLITLVLPLYLTYIS